MRSRVLLVLALLVLPTGLALSQASGGARAVAVIVSIHGDSSGRAIQHGRPLDAATLDTMLASLRPRFGATIWFSWSGGPAHRRTPGQEALLTHLRASGIRVELRTDSTMRSRVIPTADPATINVKVVHLPSGGKLNRSYGLVHTGAEWRIHDIANGTEWSLALLRART
jgi:hypothetical protein